MTGYTTSTSTTCVWRPLTKANVAVIEAQAEVPLAQTWGGGLLASVDGIRFVVPVRTIHARPNPKYFGRKRGITWLNILNDQAAGLSAKVVSGTPRDSLHFVDVVAMQQGGKVPEAIITDTGSGSGIVFGLVHLADRQYRPQLANLPDQRLWRFDPNADHGPLNHAALGRMDTEKITAHWEDTCRVAVSIHSGEVSAQRDQDDLARRQPDAVGTGHRALRADLQDPAHPAAGRRRTLSPGGETQANLVEGRHDLARRIYHGKKGEMVATPRTCTTT